MVEPPAGEEQTLESTTHGLQGLAEFVSALEPNRMQIHDGKVTHESSLVVVDPRCHRYCSSDGSESEQSREGHGQVSHPNEPPFKGAGMNEALADRKSLRPWGPVALTPIDPDRVYDQLDVMVRGKFELVLEHQAQSLDGLQGAHSRSHDANQSQHRGHQGEHRGRHGHEVLVLA